MRHESFGLSRWVKGDQPGRVAHPLGTVQAAWMPCSCRTSSMPAWLTLIVKFGPLPNAPGTPPERCRPPPGRLPAAADRLPAAAGRRRAPPGRTETRNSWRQDALDPGFHGVPAGPIHPHRAADGAGVTGVRYGASAAARTTSKSPAPMVPVGTAVPVRAVVLKRFAGPFGSPTVPVRPAVRPAVGPCRPTRRRAVPSDSALRRLRPGHPQAPTGHPQVLVSCGRRFRWVLG